MKLETRVFELCKRNHRSLSGLAEAMGVSTSQVYRVSKGNRRINEKFIIGAMKAFPGYRLDDLFYVTPNNPALRSKVMLTTTDVAHLLGLHPNTVRRWASKGILTSYRIGRRRDRRFRLEVVDGFLKEGKVEQ